MLANNGSVAPLVWGEIFRVESPDGFDLLGVSGGGLYKGPVLGRRHEAMLSNIFLRASGNSLTGGVRVCCCEAAEWLELDGLENHVEVVGRTLEELNDAQIFFKSGLVSRELISLIKNLDFQNRPDGDFLEKYIENTLSFIGCDDFFADEVEIDTYLLRIQVRQRALGNFVVVIDPIVALFFESVVARRNVAIN